MNKACLFIISAFIISCSETSDNLTGPELIQKSIEFHDPNQVWPNLKATFEFTDSLPAPRDPDLILSVLRINFPKWYTGIRI